MSILQPGQKPLEYYTDQNGVHPIFGIGAGIIESGLSDTLGSYLLMGDGSKLREGAGVVSEANGQLTLGSGQVLQADDVQEVTGNATVGVYTRSVLVTTAAAVTITIPEGCAIGHEIKIMRTVSSANAITVARSGSELIEGAATFVTHGSWAATTLNLSEVVLKKIDATNWRFVGGEISGMGGTDNSVYYTKRADGGASAHANVILPAQALGSQATGIKTLPFTFISIDEYHYTPKTVVSGGNVEAIGAQAMNGVYQAYTTTQLGVTSWSYRYATAVGVWYSVSIGGRWRA